MTKFIELIITQQHHSTQATDGLGWFIAGIWRVLAFEDLRNTRTPSRGWGSPAGKIGRKIGHISFEIYQIYQLSYGTWGFGF